MSHGIAAVHFLSFYLDYFVARLHKNAGLCQLENPKSCKYLFAVRLSNNCNCTQKKLLMFLTD